MKRLYIAKQKHVVAYAKQARFILEHGHCVAVVLIACSLVVVVFSSTNGVYSRR